MLYGYDMKCFPQAPKEPRVNLVKFLCNIMKVTQVLTQCKFFNNKLSFKLKICIHNTHIYSRIHQEKILISELLIYSLHLGPWFKSNHFAKPLNSNPRGNTGYVCGNVNTNFFMFNLFFQIHLSNFTCIFCF